MPRGMKGLRAKTAARRRGGESVVSREAEREEEL